MNFTGKETYGATAEQMNVQTDRWTAPLRKAPLRPGINPLTATLKPQSNGPSHSDTLIGTLGANWWAVTFGTAMMGLGGAPARPGLLAVPNATAHPSTASVPTSYYSMWHYNCFWSVKG